MAPATATSPRSPRARSSIFPPRSTSRSTRRPCRFRPDADRGGRERNFARASSEASSVSRKRCLHRPVELGLGNTYRASVSSGFAPSQAISATISEDPASENDERLVRRAEIGIPAMLPIQHLRQSLRESLSVPLVRFELDKRPELRLSSCHVTRRCPTDLAGHDAHSAEFFPDTNTLRDERSLNHEPSSLPWRTTRPTRHRATDVPSCQAP